MYYGFVSMLKSYLLFCVTIYKASDMNQQKHEIKNYVIRMYARNGFVSLILREEKNVLIVIHI
jgi:hypothetical protein